MRFYKTKKGTPLIQITEEMVALANATGEIAETMFNDIELMASPNDDPRDLVDFCIAESNRLREEYRHSSEYQKLRHRYKQP